MKKLLLPICAMLLCMTACQKEENNGILRLEIEHFCSDTKLHLDAAHFAVWDNNDQVLLNSDTMRVTINGNTATISGVATADNYTAVYPSSWTTSTSSITYPEFQFNFDGRVIAPMAATYDGEKLKFKNLGAILAVNVDIPMTVDRIEVIADGTTSISGTFPISYDGTRPTIGTPASTDGTNMTTLICDSVVTNSAIFYIALPPVTAQLTIKVYGDTYCYTKTQNNPLALQANHGYSINLSDNGFTTTSMPTNYQIFYTATSQLNDPSSTATGLLVTDRYYDEITKVGYFTFSGTIEGIPQLLFSGNKTITSITLPASVVSIGNNAFQGCSNLTSVSMPGVVTIGLSAFASCIALTSVSMPEVNTIGKNAFQACSKLTSVSMPKVTSIGDKAFSNCSRLKDVYCTSTSAPSIYSTNSFYKVPSGAKLHLPLSGYITLTWTEWGTRPVYYDL